MANYWEGEAKDFTKKEYWDDKQILRAGLKGAFSILRLLASQLAHAVVAEQTEDEADKAGS